MASALLRRIQLLEQKVRPAIHHTVVVIRGLDESDLIRTYNELGYSLGDQHLNSNIFIPEESFDGQDNNDRLT